MSEQSPIPEQEQEQKTGDKLIDKIKLVLWKDTHWNNLLMKFLNNSGVSWLKAFFKLFQGVNAVDTWKVEGQDAILDKLDNSIKDGTGEIVLTSLSLFCSAFNSWGYWRKLVFARENKNKSKADLKAVLDKKIANFDYFVGDKPYAAGFLVSNLFGDVTFGGLSIELQGKLLKDIKNILEVGGVGEKLNEILNKLNNGDIPMENRISGLLSNNLKIFSQQCTQF